MRKDILAAGGKSAKFAGGIGESDIDRNIMSDADRAKADKEAAQLSKSVRKATVIREFHPLGSTLLVRQVDIKVLSEKIITETIEKERPAEGVVLEIGPEVFSVNIGNTVVFGKYAGTEFKLNDEVLLIMDITDVKGTITVKKGR